MNHDAGSARFVDGFSGDELRIGSIRGGFALREKNAMLPGRIHGRYGARKVKNNLLTTCSLLGYICITATGGTDMMLTFRDWNSILDALAEAKEVCDTYAEDPTCSPAVIAGFKLNSANYERIANEIESSFS